MNTVRTGFALAAGYKGRHEWQRYGECFACLGGTLPC